MHVILIGSDAALMEGLAQSFASQGMSPTVVGTVIEACEAAVDRAPIMVVVDRQTAVTAPGEALSVPMHAGGSLVLYRGGGERVEVETPTILRRLVMAELTLPLERKRLMSLALKARERAIATGRTQPESRRPRAEAPESGAGLP